MSQGQIGPAGEPRHLAGRYELLEVIGKGGLGTVWRAIDQETGGVVAIKRLRPEFVEDSRLRRRLAREARAVARLEHPNIVRLYDVGEAEDGAPYIAMEFVQGPSLFRVMQDEVLGLEEVMALIDQILGSLAFAHARGVIHRDLKPENIVVTGGGAEERAIKLLDFGLARVEGDLDDQLTNMARDVFGTPTYMAPEQATGDYEVGPWTDLYATGILLWELVTGRPPFTGKSGTAVVVAQITAPLPSLQPLPRFSPPDGFAEVLIRALAKEPPKRYGSAGEMRRALAMLFEEGEADDDERTVVGRAPGLVAQTTEPTGSESGALRSNSELAALGRLAVVDTEGPIVGREEVQRWLWERVVAVCRGGESRVVLLEGQVGIGKSRLVDWVRRTIAEGGWMTPVSGRFRPGELVGGLRAALREAIGLGGRDAATASERLGAALGALDPSLTEHRDSLSAFLWPDTGVACPPVRAITAVETLVRTLARRRPLLLCLDDLHQADASALAVFEQLIVGLAQRPAPVLMLCTRRVDPGELNLHDGPGERIEAVLERRHEHLETVPVTRLDDPSMVTLVNGCLPLSEQVTEMVVGLARGNPLYAVRALQYLLVVGGLRLDDGRHELSPNAAPLPRSLIDLVRGRMAVALEGRADGQALRRWTERLALLGDSFHFGLVEAVARHFGEEPRAAERAVDALVRQGLLVDDASDAYAFSHELMREALLQELTGRADLPELHRRIGLAKADWYGDGPGPAAAEIGRHLFAGNDVRGGARWLLAAGRHARAAMQHGVAAALYTEADRRLAQGGPAGRDATLRADLMGALAEVALDLREHDRSERLAARLGQWAEAAGDAARAASAAVIRGEALVAAGRWVEADRVLTSAAAKYEGLGDLAGQARVNLARGRAAFQASDLASARARLAASIRGFAAINDLTGQAAAQLVMGELAIRAGDRRAAVGLLTEAAGVAERIGDAATVAQSAWRLADLLRQSGQVEAAVRRYTQALRGYEAVGSVEGIGRSLRGLADAQRILGRAEAARTYQRAVDLFESQGDQFQLAVCYTQLGRMAADSGDLDAAEAAFERALRNLERFDDPVRVGVLHAFLARVAHRRGDHAARDQRLQQALRIDASRPLVVNEWPKVLEEVAESVAAEEPARARRLWSRAAEVWAALRRADDARRCQVRAGGG